MALFSLDMPGAIFIHTGCLLYRAIEQGLIAFDRQQVVTTLTNERLDYLGLASHGIQAD